MHIGWIGSGIDLVINDKIVKILIRAGICDFEEILTRALPDKVKDADDVAASQESKR